MSSPDAIPLGWWTTADALLWAERSHAPVHLHGRPFEVWEQARQDDSAVRAGEPIVDHLRALGLIGPAPAARGAEPAADEVVVDLDGVAAPVALRRDEAAAWPVSSTAPGPPLTRCRRTPLGWVVSQAANGVPIALEPTAERARTALAALSESLQQPARSWVWIPLVAVAREHDALLVSPTLLTDPLVRAACSAHGTISETGMSALVGVRPQVLSAGDPKRALPVAGLVLDRSWSVLDPQAAPLLARWVVSCLLAAANPAASCGRYALLDAAQRLTDLPVVLLALDDTGALPDLLASAPVVRS